MLKKCLKSGANLIRAMADNVAIGMGDSARYGGDVQRACLLYSTAIKANPDCLYAYLRREEAYQRLGKFLEAKQDLETVIEKTEPILEPFPKNASQEERDRLINNAEAQLLLADLYAGPLRDSTKALLQYTKALERNYQIMPFFDDTIRERIARMHYKRAELLEGEGRYQDAISDMTNGINLVKAVENWNNMIEEGTLQRLRAYHVLERFLEAQEDFSEIYIYNSFFKTMVKIADALSDVDPLNAREFWSQAYENLQETDPGDTEGLQRCAEKMWLLSQGIRAGKNN